MKAAKQISNPGKLLYTKTIRMLSLDSIHHDCTLIKRFFITLFDNNVMPELAEISVIEMEGWKLFECHLFSPDKILYLGWDELSKKPELIEADEDTYLHYYSPIVDSLYKMEAFKISDN
ncbi:hypothetical protein EON78_02650 [bacterium]|nr:MAG: hypothetical protein EON78_02650 [bacterium]